MIKFILYIDYFKMQRLVVSVLYPDFHEAVVVSVEEEKWKR